MNLFEQLKSPDGSYEREAIQKIISYGEGFLFIDKVSSLSESKIIASFSAKPELDFFKSHFIGYPIMPGVLIIEGIGQSAVFLLRYVLEATSGHEGKDILAYEINDTKILRPVLPGMVLKYEVKLTSRNYKFANFDAIVTSSEEIVAKCSISLAIVDKSEFRR